MIKKIFVYIFIVSSMTSILRADVYSVGLDKKLYTSDFMMGKVIVSIIFPESDGSYDPNSETWSQDRQAQAVSKIMAGFDWWTKQNPSAPLSFTYVTNTVATRYEPITRPYYDETLWIPDIMGKLGYSGSKFTATKNYINDLRSQYKADWGFVVFVVDSLSDSNGKFADGLFAYSYLGGPFMVLTYDNNGYGIGNMDVVAAHEMGHIFNALDEYAGASSPSDYSYGYFPTINGNHAYSRTANDPNSIMRGGIRWGLDQWAKRMIGWVDDDNNGKMDILDRSPSVQFSPQTQSSGNSAFSGKATLSVLPRQNNNSGYGLNLDTIVGVEFKYKDSDWIKAAASDGKFDSGDESFQITIPTSKVLNNQSVSAKDVTIRVITAYSQYHSLDSGSSNSTVESTLDNAHPYPNPFKPNSDSSHINVTFTGLTSNAKVQIFTPAGEPVFEGTNSSGTGDLTWNASTAAGAKVSSGVYYYFISDGEGHTKKGKIAVIR